MEASAPRLPWWPVVLLGVILTASIAMLHEAGFGWPVRLAAIALVLVVWASWVHGRQRA
ncbi:MAG: hypothetical protein KDE27_17055 [Planctomycetes bacterium]|nr:hypothetical protein [Planctomycetota bacterium]